MADEGIEFKTGVNVGVNYSVDELLETFDAICLTGGSTQARDLPVPGRDLNGVHFAMEYLPQQNLRLQGLDLPEESEITAEGKRVVILGGGDTGADCLGTAHRQGAEIVHQYELLPEPPTERQDTNPWPQWPTILRTSGAHEEGGIRDYNILTKSFTGANGQLEKLHGVRVDWAPDENGRFQMSEIAGSEFEIETDLVLLAMGFIHPEHTGMLEQLGLDLDDRGNVKVDINKMTSIPKVFSGGDMVRGQSLVVWAIAEGREVARGIDDYLSGTTALPKTFSK
jgi:glutamate synthase (NADPH/NADH) small chain